MINNPAEVSHKVSLLVSPLTLEQPGVIMTCQNIWCERLTASPPNRASSGQHSHGRPPILFSSCSSLFSRLSVITLFSIRWMKESHIYDLSSLSVEKKLVSTPLFGAFDLALTAILFYHDKSCVVNLVTAVFCCQPSFHNQGESKSRQKVLKTFLLHC